jgi:hypothetical protein
MPIRASGLQIATTDERETSRDETNGRRFPRLDSTRARLPDPAPKEGPVSESEVVE